MALSKKHYEQIAARIKAAGLQVAKNSRGESYTAQMITLEDLTRELAADFRRDNERFDNYRFMKACGF